MTSMPLSSLTPNKKPPYGITPLFLQLSQHKDQYGALARIIEIGIIGQILCIVGIVTDDCYQIYIFGDVENMGHNFSGMDYYHWRVHHYGE